MAEKQSQVPQFGNWDSEDIPYSAYFDNARKGKKAGQIHLRDTIDAELKHQRELEEKLSKHEQHSGLEDGEMRQSIGSPNVMNHKPAINSSPKWRNPAQSRSHKLEPEVMRPGHERRVSREEGDMRRLTDSPLHSEAANLRNSSNSPRHRHGSSSTGDTPRRAARQSAVSDRSSIDHSPMHPHSQAKVGGKSIGTSSPSWERKAVLAPDGVHGLAPTPSTPGRSRLRSVTRCDDSPERSPAIPKFGDWDETDPSTGDGYSQIFNRVREEKNETGKAPVGTTTETPHTNGQKQYGNDNPKGCSCFPWGRR